jgi:ABC-type Zn uptake system ZnuABC Zn-binding protein ZnuA/Zn/Cd-binding protein ZinT
MALRRLTALLLLLFFVSGISIVGAQNEPLKVVATYSILGDIVQNIAGDNIELTVLVGPDGDSHVYEPTPQDAIALAEADIIFENGLEFETWLDDLYESSGSTATRIVVSEGIEPLAFEEGEHDHEHEDEATEITNLTPWSGEWISGWAFGVDAMQPAFDAILKVTPELTQENILAYYEVGNQTSFDTLTIDGENVTFTHVDGSSLTCAYVFAGTQDIPQVAGEVWSEFVTSDSTCADTRYLLFNPPHAAEEGSSPHFHMRYGGTSFREIINDESPWFPSFYPAGTTIDDVMGSWIVGARAVGLYIASVQGIEVAMTEEEIAMMSGAAEAESAEAMMPLRLLVTDGVENVVNVLDLESGEVLETFELNAPASVYTSPGGRYGFAVQTDVNLINVIDSGVRLEPHEDHFHAEIDAPSLLDFTFEGPLPIHFVMHDGQIVVFTDEDGTATLFTEDNLLDADAPLLTFETEAPHHGVGVPLGDVVLVSNYDPEGDDLPDGVDVFDLEGDILQTFEDCAGLHGEAALEDGAAFACSDGVMLVLREGDTFTSQVIAYPDNADETRAWGLAHDARSPYLVGDFGESALVRIDPSAGTAESIELPIPLWEFRFHPDDANKLLVLTIDGNLHVLDVASGAVENSVSVVEAFTVPEEWGEPRPSLATMPGHIFVSDPVNGQVLIVHLEDMEIESSYDIGGTPVSMTAFGLAPTEEEEHDHEGGEHDHGEFDPHIWQDPNNGIVMAENVRDALVEADEENTAAYEGNAEAYIAELTELDDYIREQVATIPESNRILVTSHDTFGYFADEYGFEVMNVLGSLSTEAADPSAGELAELIGEIQESGVPAIFTENITNPALVEQVASEAGVIVAPTLYTDALGQPGTAGETYLSMLRYNIDTITEALQ